MAGKECKEPGLFAWGLALVLEVQELRVRECWLALALVLVLVLVLVCAQPSPVHIQSFHYVRTGISLSFGLVDEMRLTQTLHSLIRSALLLPPVNEAPSFVMHIIITNTPTAEHASVHLEVCSQVESVWPTFDYYGAGQLPGQLASGGEQGTERGPDGQTTE